MSMRSEPEDRRVTVDELPALIAREEYMRAEALSSQSFSGSLRAEYGDSVRVTADELPHIIEQENLRRAYDNDRR